MISSATNLWREKNVIFQEKRGGAEYTDGRYNLSRMSRQGKGEGSKSQKRHSFCMKREKRGYSLPHYLKKGKGRNPGRIFTCVN